MDAKIPDQKEIGLEKLDEEVNEAREEELQALRNLNAYRKANGKGSVLRGGWTTDYTCEMREAAGLEAIIKKAAEDALKGENCKKKFCWFPKKG